MSKEKEKELKVKAGMKSKTLNVDCLCRVEGEGSLYIKTKGNKVEDAKLKIYEPPRFFEAFLKGRQFWDVPDLTARICGICPVAYQMSAVHALERALGVTIPDHIHQLRRLMYCGEWIESNTLHVFMLHAPDFLNYADAIAMAKDYPDIVKKGLRLKKAGNEIVKLLGAREIHPINVKVGGFYKIPDKAQFLKLAEELKQARADAYDTVKWVNSFNFPQLERPYECVSVFEEKEYPMIAGRIVTSSGLNIDLNEYENYFEEQHVSYSTALLSLMKDKGAYLVGPMARYNLNHEKLSPIVQKTIKEIGFEKVCNNPFRSIIVRSLEVLYACDEALKIIATYDWGKDLASVPVTNKRAVGYGATEAPRGLLYHRYNLDENGVIECAKLVPPTSQNQKSIEEDLRDFVSQNISMSDKELTWKCEQAIRNYDPCISCSCHFLNLEHVRG